MLRLASILLLPGAHDGPARATTNALPLLSSVVVTRGPVPRRVSSGPIHRRFPAQREFSSLLRIVMACSESTAGNSAYTIVAALLVIESSTCLRGRALTPGFVSAGGRTVNVVWTVANGGTSRCAEMMLVPAAHDGPPQRMAVASPLSSRVTVKLGPSVKTGAPPAIPIAAAQLRPPWQRLAS